MLGYKVAEVFNRSDLILHSCSRNIQKSGKLLFRWNNIAKIGYTKFQSWLAQEPAFLDIMAASDLEFLEQVDTASRILALGGVKGKDNFPGWNRFPDGWMLRFHLNTLGRRYGYGENPILPGSEEGIPKNTEHGIEIENWIKKEMSITNSEEESADDN